MSATPAARQRAPVDRLAAALLVRAAAAFPELAPDERRDALAAIDGFLAAPGPAHFLIASRALDEARTARRLAALRATASERSFRRGLDRVRTVPSLDAAAVDALAALAVEPETGARLRALAALVEAQRELAGRVAHWRRSLLVPPSRVEPRPLGDTAAKAQTTP